MDTSHTLSTQQVLRALSDLDPQVTRDQLHRWQREGVIPRPTQRGLGRGNGSESFYPDRAVQHIRRAAVLLGEHRTLNRVAWQLWLEGFEVHEKHWRPVLQTAQRNLARWSRVVARLIRFDERSESPETLADMIAKSRRAPRPLNLTWRLLQIQERARAIRILAHVCSGIELGLQHDDDELQKDEASILKFLGLNQALGDSVFGAKIKVGSQASAIFARISRSISHAQEIDGFELVPDADIYAARDYIRDAVSTVSSLQEATTWIFGKSSFGLQLLTALVNGRSQLLTATVILTWCKIEKTSEFMNHAELIWLKKIAGQMVVDSQKLQALSQTQSFRTVLRPRSIRDAFSSEKQFQAFLMRLRMVSSSG